MKSKKKKTEAALKVLLVLAIALSAFSFLKARKETLVRQCVDLLQRSLNSGSDLAVRIGGTRGNLFGFIEFKDVEVTRPLPGGGKAPVLRAKSVRFNYNFLDFISKRPDATVALAAEEPELHWDPQVSVSTPKFPFIDWMRGGGLAPRIDWSVELRNMRLVLAHGDLEVNGIHARLHKGEISITVPLTHIPVKDIDLSTVIHLEGRLDESGGTHGDFFSGRIHTEGTVVNWKPLPAETSFDFLFSKEGFHIVSSELLNGLELTLDVDFTKDYDIDLSLDARDYPFSNFDVFVNPVGNISLPGRADLDLHLQGSPWAPQLDAHTRIHDGWIGGKTFKVMDLHVSGVYPSLHLYDSRVLLADGAAMRFADKDLEAAELFEGHTYEKLIAEAQQDVVVWGDWEFSFDKAEGEEKPEFLMQKAFGKRARVQVKKLNEEPSYDKLPAKNDVQVGVGFEYRLRSKDSLKDSVKFEFREDEEIVAVEHKLRF